MFGSVEQALREADYQIGESELRWEAQNETEVEKSTALQNMKILDQLEELDDVQNVASNLLITEELASDFENQS